MVTLPEYAYTTLGDMRICRVLNGLWQVSGAHGAIDPATVLPQMKTYHDAGFVTWDLADHYGPAEDFIGAFAPSLSAAEQGVHHAFTKWVPRPGPMPRRTVEAAIDRSRQRMRTETLDLLQFHWWDYNDPGYLDALDHMTALRDAGKIRHLALTNFDTPNLKRIVDHGVRVVSNQVQYSIIDQRPSVAMEPYGRAHDVKLLAYGTLAGGLLTDRFLNQPEPPERALTTASLRKYKRMIDAWGGWSLFQDLLTALRNIGDAHNVSIANVAVRFVLEQPTVAGVIIGARLGVSEHIAVNARVFDFTLSEADYAAIAAVTDRSRDLYKIIGDTGDEYRRRW
ncbi:MAG: aldo/keto reductase [Chloroflexota bacterium]